jgi:tetratricopeptide (TPR) repeat protein
MARPSPTSNPETPRSPAQGTETLLVALALVLATLLAYSAALENRWAFDDAHYVTRNEHLRDGFTAPMLAWALQAGYASNWHPLTWLSHALDVEWYGLDPAGHHLTSLLLHLANTLLCFGLLRSLTGAQWRSALVAALFALHPLHVESVAWVSERKDVLSTLFWLATTWAWVAWVRRGGGLRQALVLACFTLGLLSKQMLVTLPFTLLLLDVWPLRRLSVSRGAWPELRARLREKGALFVLAVFGSVATYVAQSRSGAVGDLTRFPLLVRVANALVSYVAYLGDLCLPRGLSIFYPYRTELTALQVGGAAVLLVALTCFALRQLERRPYLALGWLFYLGTLVPVIGLVQIGEQARADRYTYVPSIGIFLAATWLAHDLTRRYVALRRVATAGWLGALALLALATFHQVRLWRDDQTLFRHALAVTEDNYIAHDNLGYALVAEKRLDEAIEHFEAARRARPEYAQAHNNLGRALLARGDFEAAAEHLSRARELAPDVPINTANLAFALAALGRTEEAQQAFAAAQRLAPTSPAVAGSLGRALARLGMLLQGEGREAVAAQLFARALELEPDQPDAELCLGHALVAPGGQVGEDRAAAAEGHYRHAVELRRAAPDRPSVFGQELLALALRGLARTLAAQGELPSAEACYRESLALAPGSAAATTALAWLLATAEPPEVFDPAEALELATRSSRSSGGSDPAALETLAAACAGLGDFAGAVRFARLALDAARGRGRDTAGIAQRLAGYEAGRPFRQPSVPLN